MDLPVRMRISYNLKHRYAICLETGEKFFTSLTKLVTEAKANIYSQSKKMYFYIVVIFRHLLLLLEFNMFL